MHHPRNYTVYTIRKKVVYMENRVILQDLPTSVRGFVFLDENGDPVIVLNSRLTWEQNFSTCLHERLHILRGELENEDYNEYGGGKS